MADIIILLFLGAMFLGLIVFGILIPFSLNEDAKRDVPNFMGMYAIQKAFRSKYYRPERLWVRKGFVFCSIVLYVSLAGMYIYYLSTGAFESRFHELNRKAPRHHDVDNCRHPEAHLAADLYFRIEDRMIIFASLSIRIS